MSSRIGLSTILAVIAFSGSVSSAQAAPVKLVCKGPATIAFDTDKVTEPTRISVELDLAAGWVSLDGWVVGTERLPITSSGTAVTFTTTVPGPGVVSITTGRIELSTERLYLDTTFSNGSGKPWTTNWGVQVTTLRVTGDVPCRAS